MVDTLANAAKAEAFDPDALSADFAAMRPYWAKAEAVMSGFEAVRLRGKTFLPQGPRESDANYKYRLDNAAFTNIFADIVENLASKPFGEEVSLVDSDGADARFADLCENIDGAGVNLHNFAAELFHDTLVSSLGWILVDYPEARKRADGKPLSIEDERKQNLRPYWVNIPALSMRAVHGDVVGGVFIITHARFRDDRVVVDGSDETVIPRVRFFRRERIVGDLNQTLGYGPPVVEVWEHLDDGKGTVKWVMTSAAALTIDVIPLVPYFIGRRLGRSWRVLPAMRTVLERQVEHYQTETALKSAKELVAYPMLAGLGVEPRRDTEGNPVPLAVGPNTTLYAPPLGENSDKYGDWKYVEVDSAGLTFLSAELEKIEAGMRELGRQPLIASQMTVVQASMNAAKVNSVIEGWALGLKDVLEMAFVYTAKWFKVEAAKAPQVRVNTNFVSGLEGDGAETLVSLRASGPGGTPDISRETLWDELKRKGRLSADFDPVAEEARLIEEMPDVDSEEDQLAATGYDPGAEA